MADDTGQTPGAGATSQTLAAGRALENLAELEPELKAAAVFDAGGNAVATSGGGAVWSSAASGLLASLDSVRQQVFDSAHLATESAEVFVVREDGFSLVAVTGRFVLASLTSFDMRMALRDAITGVDRA